VTCIANCVSKDTVELLTGVCLIFHGLGNLVSVIARETSFQLVLRHHL
jgi:hypothetical protein